MEIEIVNRTEKNEKNSNFYNVDNSSVNYDNNDEVLL